jgi:hypothetical protein
MCLYKGFRVPFRSTKNVINTATTLFWAENSPNTRDLLRYSTGGEKIFLCGKVPLDSRIRELSVPMKFLVETAAQIHESGRVIFSGRTSLSNSAAVTAPLRSASSRRLLPLLWAALAIAAALS